MSILINGIFLFAALQVINIGLFYLKNNKSHGSINKSSAKEQQNRIYQRVQMLSERGLKDTQGDRIIIMEFFEPGIMPPKFISCKYEFLQKGHLPLKDVLSRISAFRFKEFLRRIDTERYVIIDDELPEPISRVGLELMDEYELKALCVEIKDTKGFALGYVALIKEHDFLDKDISIMIDIARQLGYL
jgi:hypothetical protein